MAFRFLSFFTASSLFLRPFLFLSFSLLSRNLLLSPSLLRSPVHFWGACCSLWAFLLPCSPFTTRLYLCSQVTRGQRSARLEPQGRLTQALWSTSYRQRLCRKRWSFFFFRQKMNGSVYSAQLCMWACWVFWNQSVVCVLEHGHGNVSLASVWCLYMKVCVGGSETRCTFYVVKILQYFFHTCRCFCNSCVHVCKHG